jgi:hypothetical protein
MELITSVTELKANLRTLESYLKSDNPAEAKYAKDRIKMGTCFVAYKQNGEYKFGPSRFVGYRNNSISAHENNWYKDGRETNPKISSLIGHKEYHEAAFEESYKKYCISLGFEPKASGSWGVTRKYWELKE